MSLATYLHQHQRFEGVVDATRQTVTPLPTSAGDMLQIIARHGDLMALPEATDTAVPLDQIRLQAPIPRPRRDVFCVGRNYHAHAKALSRSVFKDSPADATGWPIVSCSPRSPSAWSGRGTTWCCRARPCRRRSTTKPRSPWRSASAARTSRALMRCDMSSATWWSTT